jgi:hypothetical protein
LCLNFLTMAQRSLLNSADGYRCILRLELHWRCLGEIYIEWVHGQNQVSVCQHVAKFSDPLKYLLSLFLYSGVGDANAGILNEMRNLLQVI